MVLINHGDNNFLKQFGYAKVKTDFNKAEHTSKGKRIHFE